MTLQSSLLCLLPLCWETPLPVIAVCKPYVPMFLCTLDMNCCISCCMLISCCLTCPDFIVEYRSWRKRISCSVGLHLGFSLVWIYRIYTRISREILDNFWTIFFVNSTIHGSIFWLPLFTYFCFNGQFM